MEVHKIHIAWWGPTNRWSAMCDKHWSCRTCRMGIRPREFVMGEGTYNVSVSDEDLSKVTCTECLRIFEERKAKQDET